MKLFTKEIDTKLFEQYLTGSDLENQMVVAKIFNPYGRGTWYLLNSDPEDPEYLWAIVDMDDIEVGSVNRSDLENIRIKPFMLGLERDLSFRQMNALELYEGLNEGKKYLKGGSVEAENKEMVLNNNKQIAHHTKEISAAVKNAKNVPAWVVAKVNRSASDLSDATHYMEGQSESYAEGGAIYKHKHMDATAKILEKTNKGYKVEFTDNSMKKPKTKIMYFLDINFDKDKGYFEKMETGGGVGITESDIIEGVSFKNKSGTIFVIDKIELDPKFGKLVISSLLGGKKGNYRDEITDFIAFLNKEKVVKYETGGGVEEKWQIKDSNDKYFSVSMQTGKPVWNESPDLGYSYEKQEAEKIKDKLVELGNKDLKVVEYNANWWKMKTGGGVQQPSYAIKLSELLNKYEPTLIGISRGMVKVTPSMAYSGAELSNMFKGFGDSMDIKNIVYRSLRDKESYPIVEKLTKGKYKLIKPTWTDNFEDYYFDNITKKEKGGEVESKLTGWKHKKK